MANEDVFKGEQDVYWYLGVCGCKADIEAGPYSTADEAEREGRRRYAAHMYAGREGRPQPEATDFGEPGRTETA